MEDALGVGKKRHKVNINKFGQRLNDKDLKWEAKWALIGGYNLTALFPCYVGIKFRSDFEYPDLGKSHIRTISWLNYIKKSEKKGRVVWLGSVDNKAGEGKMEYPILLEFPKESLLMGGQTHYPVSTPSGRPGDPATILIDRDGEIVPDLYFLQRGEQTESRVKIYLLSHSWDRFGWNDNYPALALQFLEGKCTRSRDVIDRWQAFLMRNRS